ncbi:hypothetical protein [Clostridium puniceum]|uniref:hypothetical protein n=1 Tax=Clostridium puniceum TaxID=29367 RepID=UPI0013014A77|nr:hypothetical protein [Clostridium puniceum]
MGIKRSLWQNQTSDIFDFNIELIIKACIITTSFNDIKDELTTEPITTEMGYSL